MQKGKIHKTIELIINEIKFIEEFSYDAKNSTQIEKIRLKNKKFLSNLNYSKAFFEKTIEYLDSVVSVTDETILSDKPSDVLLKSYREVIQNLNLINFIQTVITDKNVNEIDLTEITLNIREIELARQHGLLVKTIIERDASLLKQSEIIKVIDVTNQTWIANYLKLLNFIFTNEKIILNLKNATKLIQHLPKCFNLVELNISCYQILNLSGQISKQIKLFDQIAEVVTTNLDIILKYYDTVQGKNNFIKDLLSKRESIRLLEKKERDKNKNILECIEKIKKINFSSSTRENFSVIFDEFKDTLFSVGDNNKVESFMQYIESVITHDSRKGRQGQAQDIDISDNEVTNLSLTLFVVDQVLPQVNDEIQKKYLNKYMLLLWDCGYRQMIAAAVKAASNFQDLSKHLNLERYLGKLIEYLDPIQTELLNGLVQFYEGVYQADIQQKKDEFYDSNQSYLIYSILLHKYYLANFKNTTLKLKEAQEYIDSFKAFQGMLNKYNAFKYMEQEKILSIKKMSKEIENVQKQVLERQENLSKMCLWMDDYEYTFFNSVIGYLKLVQTLNESQRSEIDNDIEQSLPDPGLIVLDFLDEETLRQAFMPVPRLEEMMDYIHYFRNILKIEQVFRTYADVDGAFKILYPFYFKFKVVIDNCYHQYNLNSYEIDRSGVLVLDSQLDQLTVLYKHIEINSKSLGKKNLATCLNPELFKRQINAQITYWTSFKSVRSLNEKLVNVNPAFFEEFINLFKLMLDNIYPLPLKTQLEILTLMRRLLITQSLFYGKATDNIKSIEGFVSKKILRLDRLCAHLVDNLKTIMSLPLVPGSAITETPSAVNKDIPVRACNTLDHYYPEVDKPLKKKRIAKRKNKDTVSEHNSEDVYLEFLREFSELNLISDEESKNQAIENSRMPEFDLMSVAKSESIKSRIIDSSIETIKKITLSLEIQKILCVLENPDSNKWAYVVGGYVRDQLMGVSVGLIHDIDIVTNNPDALNIINQAGFTCVRSKKRSTLYYISYRGLGEKPIELELSNAKTIEGDAYNRDITINALYANSKGIVVDPLKRIHDVDIEYLSLVNHAYERLKSDPTRIFRVIYYAVKCDKKIPDYVKKWINELAPNLSKLPFGIFKHHIEKWFYSEHFDKMLTLLVELDSLKCLLRFSDEALQHKYVSLFTKRKNEITTKLLDLKNNKGQFINLGADSIVFDIMAVLILPLSFDSDVLERSVKDCLNQYPMSDSEREKAICTLAQLAHIKPKVYLPSVTPVPQQISAVSKAKPHSRRFKKFSMI